MRPLLRFPEFSDEWKVKTIDEVYTPLRSNSLSRENLSKNGVIKNIHYGDIHKNLPLHIDLSETKLPAIINSSVVKIPDYIKEGDLLIADASEDYADIGKVVEVTNTNGEAVLAGLHTIPLRPKEDIALGFGSYLFSTTFVHNQMRKIANGISVYGISKTNLANITVYLPLKPEQQKIADFLIIIDRRLAKSEKKLELLRKYKKGTVQEIFTQIIRFNDEDGSAYPEWEDKKLGEVGKFKSGVGFSDIQQGGKAGVPFFKVSDMNLPNNKSIMREANNYVTDEQIKQIGYKPITSKSIIFAKVGAAIFLERKRVAEGFLLDNNMMAYTPNKSVNFDFTRICFERLQLSKMAQIGALPSYNASDLAILKIPVPSTAEQQEIATFITILNDKIKEEEIRFASVKLWKKGLLQRMFIL